MIRTELLAALPPLRTDRLFLRPMGPQYFPQVWRTLADDELRRLTGTHLRHTEQQVRDHLERIGADRSRADWAILRREDASYLGEVVLNGLDVDNESMNYRISLRETKICGQGYGTEAGRAVINFGLAVLGLHRIGLEVYQFNERAIASYRKLGFQPEGVLRQALCWDGRWYDAQLMSILAADASDHSPPGPAGGATSDPSTTNPTDAAPTSAPATDALTGRTETR